MSTHLSTPLSTPEFIAVVPARLASTRLPDKPLADIGGKPMVVRVAERARLSGAQQVLIATDSPRVVEVAKEHGFEVLLTRADHPNGTDRLAEVATHFGWSDETIVVNVQGDEPLIDPALVRNVAAHLAAFPACAIATAAHPIHDPADVFNPNVVKVVLDAQGVALYFSRAPIPWSRDTWQAHWPDVAALASLPTALATAAAPLRHIGLYAYRAKFLRVYPTLRQAPIEEAEALEQLRALWHGERIAVLVTRDAPPPGVDTPADLARVRALFPDAA